MLSYMMLRIKCVLDLNMHETHAMSLQFFYIVLYDCRLKWEISLTSLIYVKHVGITHS